MFMRYNVYQNYDPWWDLLCNLWYYSVWHTTKALSHKKNCLDVLDLYDFLLLYGSIHLYCKVYSNGLKRGFLLVSVLLLLFKVTKNNAMFYEHWKVVHHLKVYISFGVHLPVSDCNNDCIIVWYYELSESVQHKAHFNMMCVLCSLFKCLMH